MAKKGKKLIAAKAKVDALKQYPLPEAVALVKEVSTSKFVGTVEMHLWTYADPKYNDQMLRGIVVLPNGTGKKIRIAAFVDTAQVDAALKAGATRAGKEDILADVEAGKIDFDVLITTNDMMRDLAKAAKVLGPKGLMPSPKAGTISNDLAKTIDELQKGRVEYKLDKTGNVHVIVGKTNFTDQQIIENIEAILRAIHDNKPAGVKGKLLRKVVLAPTMGPGVQVAWAE